MVDPKRKRYLYLMLAGFGAIGLSILLFFILDRMRGIWQVLDGITTIILPFIYGGVVAYLLRPLCNAIEAFLQKHLPTMFKKSAPGLAVFFSLIIMLLLVYALIAMIAPKVYDSVVTLWNTTPGRLDRFLKWAESTFVQDEKMASYFSILNTSYEKLYDEIDEWTRNLIPKVTTLVSGVGSSVFKIVRTIYNLLVGLIVAVYLLASRKRFAKQGALIIRSSFSERWANSILDEFKLIDSMFGGFIDSKILDSAIIGVLCYIGCRILRIPNTLLVSVFVGFSNVIPFFGPFIGAVPSTLLILIEDPIKALWFLIFVVVLQQVDGNVIGPRIMGDRIGLSGFWVMFAIIFFGGTWGIVGMVVGVPLTAVIYDLVRKLVKNGLHRKGKDELWQQYVAEYPSEEQNQERSEKQKKTFEEHKKDFQQLFSEIAASFVLLWKELLRGLRHLKKWILQLWEKICCSCKIVWNLLRILLKKIRNLFGKKNV